jgi:hypothetical protein
MGGIYWPIIAITFFLIAPFVLKSKFLLPKTLLKLMNYNVRRLMGSRIIESAAYCNQIASHMYV